MAQASDEPVMRYPLSPLGRQALWEAYNRLCYYCRRSIGFRELEVDHLVPERLGASAEVWASTRAELGLPDTFDIQGLINLVPACRQCNGDKSGRPFFPGRVAIDLGRISGRRVEVEERIALLRRSDQRERARAAVLVAIAEGAMDWPHLRELERAHANDQGIFEALLDGFPFTDRAVAVAKSDLDQRLDRPVEAEPLDGKGLPLMRMSGETCVVHTLREYRQANADEYFAGTTFTMAMEALYFRRPLTLLELVAVARYPDVSHMASPRLGLSDLNRLPAILLFVTEEMTSDDVFAGQRAALEGLTIQDLLDRGEAQIMAVSSMHLRLNFAGGITFLMELMRADTNDDGIEELVVYRVGGPEQGTYRSTSIIALAIREAGDDFAEVPLMVNSAGQPVADATSELL
ncbi:HNH endonuclease domain-containing protein [Dyella sp. 333MFSha]|uniref:HNH endonuclease n=1 Tax=Dyella sp. 333MFSha TaxID=1798240 RepID=UPI0015A03B7C|nr:HNH endonuclease domain-containing protein [Dyella sp. 333MFSha]